MTERTAKFATTILLLISAPFLVYAVRHFLQEDYAGMFKFLFMGLSFVAAASEPEFLTRKVSEAMRTPAGEFDEVSDRTFVGDVCFTLAAISLLGWIVFALN